MILFKLFSKARRRFGFWRTLLVAFALLWGLYFVANATSAPPRDAGAAAAPIRPNYSGWASDAEAFDGTRARVCRTDHSSCSGEIHVQARLLNRPAFRNSPIAVQLLLTYRTTQCADLTCSGTLLPTPTHRPVYLFVNGVRAEAWPIIWESIYGTRKTWENGPIPTEVSETYVSQPLYLGFAACGWFRINFGILGDYWNGRPPRNPDGTQNVFPPVPAAWALAVPMPVYLGDCKG
jgi:hypothetical protein